MSAPACSFCHRPLQHRLVDLGASPLANALLTEEILATRERLYPLVAWVCGNCFLVQMPPVERRETVFSDAYPYLSSISSTWREHVERYAAEMSGRLELGPDSLVIEVASNDGTMLVPFQKRGVPVLGIEPAASVARAARDCGVPTHEAFFGRELAVELAASGRRPDLLLGNNVLAHVPDLHDFVGGMKELLKPDGIITLEFPHLLRLIEDNLLDTIYHEHLSYFSLGTVGRIFSAHDLTVFDAQELTTHGGSLRIFVRHRKRGLEAGDTVAALLRKERERGLDTLEGFSGFQDRADAVRRDLVEFLTNARVGGKTVVGYGAPAKATTLLNFCGIGPDLLPYTVDLNESKQGRYLPGVRIPVREPKAIDGTRPDFLLILPWNLRREITAQMSGIRDWGGRFVVALPRLEIFDGP